ncbi:MAG: hypothetical protein H6721_00115 [Sandaracinus sp.]|nr:hypothetical protein [Sandaracinus sp.]MCB9614458.1 hypothetical protein [Sandaracinus sp.]MCB9618600.1 hypothetical protein [Sandaracinus sp.]MCB9630547.1 hypothetical protein [Sandaracinus sp.]
MSSSPETPSSIPWPWLLLGGGLLVLGRYFFDETTTETTFRVGLGLCGVGAAWIFAKSILLRPTDRTVVERAADQSTPQPAGERFTLPPGRFTLPPGGSLEGLVPPQPAQPPAAAAPVASVPVAAPIAVQAPAGVPLDKTIAPGQGVYVAGPVGYGQGAVPQQGSAPVHATFEDPEPTMLVRGSDETD